jgi:succinoglycan biosynthesis protein ExoA
MAALLCPTVSIVVPCRNEKGHIETCIESILRQQLPGGDVEVIVADGMSEDGTREILKRLARENPRLRVVDNQGRITPCGMNAGIREARGYYIAIMSAHCTYPPDYLRRLIALIEETGADSVGPVLVARGSSSYAPKAICGAYRSPLSVGGALRSYERTEFTREVDAVHGGCWRKETLLSAGLLDEEMVRNQDDELSFRLRAKGCRIIQTSTIRVQWYVRDNFSDLFKQFLQYGYWKVRVIRKHPAQASLRHFMPATFLGILMCFALLAPFRSYGWLGLLAMLVSYIGVMSVGAFIEAARSEYKLWPGIVLALIAMHVGYGLGFIVALLQWPSTWGFTGLTR